MTFLQRLQRQISPARGLCVATPAITLACVERCQKRRFQSLECGGVPSSTSGARSISEIAGSQLEELHKGRLMPHMNGPPPVQHRLSPLMNSFSQKPFMVSPYPHFLRTDNELYIACHHLALCRGNSFGDFKAALLLASASPCMQFSLQISCFTVLLFRAWGWHGGGPSSLWELG